MKMLETRKIKNANEGYKPLQITKVLFKNKNKNKK